MNKRKIIFGLLLSLSLCYCDKGLAATFTKNSELCKGYSSGYSSSSINSSFSGNYSGAMVSGSGGLVGQTICSSSKSYGDLTTVLTHPGGSYTTGFTYSASIACSYVSEFECRFIKYLTGETGKTAGTCSEEGQGDIPGSGQPSPSGWNEKPNTLYLTDDTDNVIAEMEYTSLESGDSSGVIDHLYTSFKEIQMTEYDDITADLANSDQEIYRDTNGSLWEFAEDGGMNHVVDENGNIIEVEADYDFYYKIVTSNEKIETDQLNNTITKTCGNRNTDCVPTATTDDCKMTRDQKKDHPMNKWTITWNNVNNIGGTTCQTTTYNKGKSNEYVYYSCSSSYKCSGVAEKKYVVYYAEKRESFTESETGIYQILTESSPSDRFEKVKEKFIPLATLTGNYLYYISECNNSNKNDWCPTAENDFGKRACNLVVVRDPNPPVPPNPPVNPEYWMEFIDFRNVNVNNLFPGRQPGKNWAPYDKNLSVVNYTGNDPMYTITLTPTAMRSIAKTNDLDKYINWTLPSTYSPVTLNGNIITGYDWQNDYLNTEGFKTLTDLGAVIVRNADVIQKRNAELISKGYNLYYAKRQGGE